MKILFFGDIVGRAGRAAVTQILPDWRAKYAPDILLANVDNIAHGKGVSRNTLTEFIKLGFNAFTSGDHILSTSEGDKVLNDPSFPVVRPANFLPPMPGAGYLRIPTPQGDVLLIHLIGQVFMRGEYESPFSAVDQIIKQESIHSKPIATIVDFHAEATSEKVALGWYLNGRVTAVLGTHTHIPTADEWIMPNGTAYISDIGMVGARDSVIGVKTEQSLSRFLTNQNTALDPVEQGITLINAILIEFNFVNSQATNIHRLQTNVIIA